MYSFRYHLATICAVFLALAIGLLLGASIASSKAFEDTTTQAVESLRTEFDGVISQNTKLSAQLESSDALSADLLSQWERDRLSGMHVIVMKNARPTQTDETAQLVDLLVSSGARVTVVSLEDTSLGTDSAETSLALKKLLPEVNGEDYTVTLARALVAEWTAGTSGTGATASAGTSASTSGATAPAATASTVAGNGSASSVQVVSGTVSGSLAPSVAITAVRTHPLTDLLVSKGIISVSNAGPDDVSSADSFDTVVDALIDLCVDEKTATESTSTASPVSNALRLDAAASASGLPVVLTQTSALSAKLLSSASELGVSGVADMTSVTGRYSIVALLSGADAGVYSLSASGAQTYPSIPD